MCVEDQPAAVFAHSPAQHGALAQEMRGSLGSIGPLNTRPLVTRPDWMVASEGGDA